MTNIRILARRYRRGSVAEAATDKKRSAWIDGDAEGKCALRERAKGREMEERKEEMRILGKAIGGGALGRKERIWLGGRDGGSAEAQRQQQSQHPKTAHQPGSASSESTQHGHSC